MQNFGQFYTTSDFDRECIRKDTNYPKSERYVISRDSSRVQQNKSDELWSIVQKVGHVSLDPPKSTFSADYISAPGASPWFFYTLDIHQGLLAHTTNRFGGPSKILRANI